MNYELPDENNVYKINIMTFKQYMALYFSGEEGIPTMDSARNMIDKEQWD
jgi:hypothetical protein